MQGVKRTKQNIFTTVKDKLDGFLYSSLFQFTMAFIVVLCHTFGWSLVGLAIFVLIACYVLLTRKDVTPVIPLAFFVVFVFNDFSVTAEAPFYVIVAPALICFILHVILYPSKKFVLGKLFLPLIAVSTALILGGLFSSLYRHYYLSGLLEIGVFGPLVLLVYVFFRNNVCPKDSFNLEKYFFLALILSAFIGTAEFFDDLIIFGREYIKDFPNTLGWGNFNVVSTLLVMIIPALCYFMTKAKHVTPYIVLTAFVYVSVFLCTSDACKGIALVMAIPCAVYTFVFIPKNKKRLFLSAFLITLAIALIALAVLLKTGKLDYLMEAVSFSDSGRNSLYEEAINCFKNSPLFGAGMGYNPSGKGFQVGGKAFYNFHSTFFHVLAKTGIVGIIAYAFYFFIRYKVLMNKHTSYNVFMTLSFSCVSVYALIDTAEFNILPFVIMFTLIILTTEILNEKKRGKIASF